MTSSSSSNPIETKALPLPLNIELRPKAVCAIIIPEANDVPQVMGSTVEWYFKVRRLCKYVYKIHEVDNFQTYL